MNTVIVTDGQYRMALSAVRQFHALGFHTVVISDPSMPPLASRSRSCREAFFAPAGEETVALVLELCRRYPRPLLFPVGLATLTACCQHKGELEALCRCLLPTAEVLEKAGDKSQVRDAAQALDIPVPQAFSPEADETETQFFDRVPLPAVVKFREGEKLGLPAAQRYAIVHTKEALEEAYRRFAAIQKEPLVQSYVNGEARGVCVVMDGQSRPVSLLCHRRLQQYPLSGGPSCRCETVWDEEVQRLAAQSTALLTHLGFTGVAMVEFKGDHLLEINPRIWGSFPLTAAAESDFCAVWAQAASGNESEICQSPRCRNGVKMQFFLSDLRARSEEHTSELQSLG